MKGSDILNDKYSPYDMNNEASRLIDECRVNGLAQENELQIILLINKAQTYTNMSKYQLSFTRKKFAELYYSLGITGNALEQYKLAIELNNRLPIKRVLSSLEKIPKNDLVYSLDTNMFNEPDLSKLKEIPSINEEDILKRLEQHKKEHAAFWGMSSHEYEEYEINIQNELYEEVATEDSTFDLEFEKMLNSRIEKLDDMSKMAFQQIRGNIKSDGALSINERLLLALEALERSQNYNKESKKIT